MNKFEHIYCTVLYCVPSFLFFFLGLSCYCPLFPPGWSAAAFWFWVSRTALLWIQRYSWMMSRWFYGWIRNLKLVSVLPGELFNGSSGRGGLQTSMFDRPSDWDREIKRTGASEWRVCSINQNYAISPRFATQLGWLRQWMIVVASRACLWLLQFGCFKFYHLLSKSAIRGLFWQEMNLL